jgi:hypothetical protein
MKNVRYVVSERLSSDLRPIRLPAQPLTAGTRHASNSQPFQTPFQSLFNDSYAIKRYSPSLALPSCSDSAAATRLVMTATAHDACCPAATQTSRQIANLFKYQHLTFHALGETRLAELAVAQGLLQ